MMMKEIVFVNSVVFMIRIRRHHQQQQQQQQQQQRLQLLLVYYYLLLMMISISCSTAITTATTGYDRIDADNNDNPTLASDIKTRINPIIIQSNKFIDSVTKKEFFIRGIDYYPRPNYGDWNKNSFDYFTNNTAQIWLRDINYMKQLNINAIRLYSVNASENHDQFMCALMDAGIYVMVSLVTDCPTCAITRDKAPNCYPPQLKVQGQSVINAFAKYNNTLAFSAGNEVNNFVPLGIPQWNAPCQKQFLHDMRQYINSCPTMRKVPVGLVSADNFRMTLATYYSTHENTNHTNENVESVPTSNSNTSLTIEPSSSLSPDFDVAEWYGLNSYVFCDGNAKTYKNASGFKAMVYQFQQAKLPFPIILTEFGCLSTSFQNITSIENGTGTETIYESQRTFDDARWLMNEIEVHEVLAGGFAFEYSVEAENAKSETPYPFNKFGKQRYGIGYFSPEHCDDYKVMCTYNPFPEFEHLKQAYANHKNMNNYNYTDSINVSYKAEIVYSPEMPIKIKQFPRLDSFVWKTDQTKNLRCPVTKESETVTYQCQVGNTNEIGASSLEQANQQQERTRHLVLALLFVISVLLIIITGMVLVRNPFRIDPDWCFLMDDFASTSSPIDSDDASAEALLSLTDMITQGSPIQNYSTISLNDPDDSLSEVNLRTN